MSVELLYTSAEQGLRQGSRGFCTVLSTVGMPLNLAAKLEALSGYRHLYPIDSPNYSDNPVAYSHLMVTVGGRPVSILSRVAAYQADYSGRTNKLAHHVVVEASEAAAAGPVWLLQQPGVMRDQWDGQCANTVSGPFIPSGDQPGGVCHTWQQVMGDAGWGGVLAGTVLGRASKPMWVIFDITQQNLLLPLINESIALLPAHERWRATFSTYASSIPPDVDCKIRCVLADSEEARFAPARGQVIQLKPTALTLPNTAWVAAARGEAAPASAPERLQVPAAASGPPRLPVSKKPAVGPPAVQPEAFPPQLQQTFPPPKATMEDRKKPYIKAIAVAALAVVVVAAIASISFYIGRARPLPSVATGSPDLSPQISEGEGMPPTQQPPVLALAAPAPPTDTQEPSAVMEDDASIDHEAAEPSQTPLPVQTDMPIPEAEPADMGDANAGANPVMSNTGLSLSQEASSSSPDPAADMPSMAEASDEAAAGMEPVMMEISIASASSDKVVARGKMELTDIQGTGTIRWVSSNGPLRADSAPLGTPLGDIDAKPVAHGVEFVVKPKGQHPFLQELNALKSNAQNFRREAKSFWSDLKKKDMGSMSPTNELSKPDDQFVPEFVEELFSSNPPKTVWESKLQDAANAISNQLSSDQNAENKELLKDLKELQGKANTLQKLLEQAKGKAQELKKGSEVDTGEALEVAPPADGSVLGRIRQRRESYPITFLFRVESSS